MKDCTEASEAPQGRNLARFAVTAARAAVRAVVECAAAARLSTDTTSDRFVKSAGCVSGAVTSGGTTTPKTWETALTYCWSVKRQTRAGPSDAAWLHGPPLEGGGTTTPGLPPPTGPVVSPLEPTVPVQALAPNTKAAITLVLIRRMFRIVIPS